jgi:arylsulfatase A-like enzyme
VTRRALDWLKARRDPRPFFLYLHTVDPHLPYDPPEPHRGRFAATVTDPTVGSMPMMRALERSVGAPVDEEIRGQLVDLYDAEIAANDASFGAFVGGLHELGLYDDALVVFVSDHGEEFFDHGWWEHGDTLYAEQLFVPLLIKFPGRRMAGRRTDVVGCHVDLLPTILASAGAAIPGDIDGRSLLPYLDGRADARRAATAYLDLDGNRLESIVLERSKLIRNSGESLFPARPPVQLFDLDRDPRERSNLAAERAVAAGYLQALLRSTTAGKAALSGEARALPPQVQEQLRALGYAP